MTSNIKNQEYLNTLHTFNEVKERYYVYITKQEDRDAILRAFEFVQKHHEGQFRKSGEPYIHHLIEVAYILTELQAGPATIIAGLLHDVVEDTDVEIEEIVKLWGKDVATIVDSVTKIQRLKLSRRGDDSDFVYEDHRKIFLGMAKDIRVIIIKLADRLHNMRTLDFLKPDRQLVIAKETMEVFAPIASRLGMNKIKSEMEDLALKYIDNPNYLRIRELVDSKSKGLQKSLTDISKRIADIIFKNNIPFEMRFRVKSIYSIYKKMVLKDHDFDHIYDLLALRIITKTELNCYEVLGIIHATYKPVTGRFKDYIAMPKSNMYQSLHTTIFSGDGNALEVQIRTKEMDDIAESGIAAHWRYKEGTNYNPEKEQREIEEKLHWFRDFVGVSKDFGDDAKEYIDTLTKEIFETSVYVFTPKGNVVELPAGATPLDFAYKIHTKVGDSAIGAIVNNTMVSLGTVLKTGDIVEIKTSKNPSGPNEGWLNIAVTSSAKNHIKKYLTRKNAELMRDTNIVKGKNSLLDAFKLRGYTDTDFSDNIIANTTLLKNFNVSDIYELYLLVNSRNILPAAILDYLKMPHKKTIKLFKGKTTKDTVNPVLVEGAGQVAVTLGHCCTPIPGDKIVGYITKGKGITCHRVGCPNIKNTDRLILVKWNPDLASPRFPTDIAIKCNDRENLLIDIMNALSQAKVVISKIKAVYHHTTKTSTIHATVLVTHNEDLDSIFNIVRNVNSVFEINRTIH